MSSPKFSGRGQVGFILDDSARWTNDDSRTHAVSGGQRHHRIYLPRLLRLAP